MNADSLATPHRSSASFRLFMRCLQMILFAILSTTGFEVQGAEMRVGNVYSVTFADVDQRQHSTSDGHVTVLTVVTRKDEERAQMVGDRYPQIHLGNPHYQLITVVNFLQKMLFPFRGIALEIIRYRLDSEAKELQKIYATRHLNRNARSDMFVVADFDGKIVSQFGIPPSSSEFVVLVFDGRGHLIRRWTDAPTAEALNAAMNEATR